MGPDGFGRGPHDRLARTAQGAVAGLSDNRCLFSIGGRCRLVDAGGEPGEFGRREWQVYFVEVERVRDRVGETDWRRHAIAFADAFGAEGREGRRAFEVQDTKVRYLGRSREQIVGQGAGQEGAVLAINEFLVHGGAESLGEAAAHLAFDHPVMQHDAAIMHGDVAIDVELARCPIDLDAAKIEDEPMTQRRGDMVGLVGRGEFGRGPEGRLANGSVRAVGKQPRSPMARRRDACERQERVGIGAGGDAAIREDEVVAAEVHLGGGDPGELVAQTRCRELRHAGDRGREAARIIARRDRPGVLGGVEIGHDPNLVGGKAEHLGHHLRQNGAVTLSLRDGGDLDRDGADGIEGDRGGRLRAVLRAGLCPLGRGQDGRDVSHVRHAGLNGGRIPDAVKTALGARRSLSAAQFGQGRRRAQLRRAREDSPPES